MNLIQRTDAFVSLGIRITRDMPSLMDTWAPAAAMENPWFTRESVFAALQGIAHMLQEDSLRQWVAMYPGLHKVTPRTIGLACAGNIPAVGFHDFLSVVLSGHQLAARLSAKDTVLMKGLAGLLQEVAPGIEKQWQWADKLVGVDGVIATGSDNTARYFEYYFRNIPHIIRKNRTSVAVVSGRETRNDWLALGKDVFTYFGLGCRNVSKLYVPTSFKPDEMIETWQSFQNVAMHHKYLNNLDYQKSLLLINQTPFLDGGFFMLKQDEGLVSPISCIFLETYENEAALALKLAAWREKIQVIASAEGWVEGSVPFGTTQWPDVDDYADGVDTLLFLSDLPAKGA